MRVSADFVMITTLVVEKWGTKGSPDSQIRAGKIQPNARPLLYGVTAIGISPNGRTTLVEGPSIRTVAGAITAFEADMVAKVQEWASDPSKADDPDALRRLRGQSDGRLGRRLYGPEFGVAIRLESRIEKFIRKAKVEVKDVGRTVHSKFASS